MKYLQENLVHKIKNGTKFLISDWFGVIDSEFADKFFSPLFWLQLDRSTARYIYRENKIELVDLSIHAQKEKCLFIYSTITLFYKDLF